MPSSKANKDHPNRKPHNFSIYDTIDRVLTTNSSKFRGSVYDLGCGEMPYKEWVLAQNGVTDYVGVDWGETLHRLRADIVANLNDPLPIADHAADTVLSLSVMEHLCEPATFLAEAHRILKPGGYLILQVPFMWKVHEAPYDYYRYTRHGLEYLLDKEGFEQIEVVEQTGFFVMLALKFNYFLLRLLRGPRIIRWPLTALARFAWCCNQWTATTLDRFLTYPEETAGYFAICRRPERV
jgi:SAM-dependent methyltransferase